MPNMTVNLWRKIRDTNRRTIGSARASDVEPSSLERSLRLAYEETYFCKTQIYSSIRLWESSNHLFKVLRNDIQQFSAK